jgi:hypothetical protein
MGARLLSHPKRQSAIPRFELSPHHNGSATSPDRPQVSASLGARLKTQLTTDAMRFELSPHRNGIATAELGIAARHIFWFELPLPQWERDHLKNA